MKDRTLLRTGIIGSAVAAVCCFTPALVVAFGALGLSALMGWWLDYFLLFPALAFFLALTGYAAIRLKRRARTGASDRRRSSPADQGLTGRTRRPPRETQPAQPPQNQGE